MLKSLLVSLCVFVSRVAGDTCQWMFYPQGGFINFPLAAGVCQPWPGSQPEIASFLPLCGNETTQVPFGALFDGSLTCNETEATDVQYIPVGDPDDGFGLFPLGVDCSDTSDSCDLIKATIEVGCAPSASSTITEEVIMTSAGSAAQCAISGTFGFFSQFELAVTELTLDAYRYRVYQGSTDCDETAFLGIVNFTNGTCTNALGDGISLTFEPYSITQTPTGQPTSSPTDVTPSPSEYPSSEPTSQPTGVTAEPSTPSIEPTESTDEPTAQPTLQPSAGPTLIPTARPTLNPTGVPFPNPTLEPTKSPTLQNLETTEANDDDDDQDACDSDATACESRGCSDPTVDNNELCERQRNWGCAKCAAGSFKRSNNHLCVPCDSIDNCLECKNFQGCKTCADGFSLRSDPSCGLKTCFSDECQLSISECDSTKCAGAGDNPNCVDQKRWGCKECAPGFFHKNFQFPCVECSTTIDGCLECKNWSGCTKCEPGKTIFRDKACGLNICL